MDKDLTHRCLAIISPQLSTEWHPTKNNSLTPYDVFCSSGKKFWWLCPKCKYEWQARINNRYNGTDCPKCAGHIVTPENCLAATHPHLVEEWHPTRNIEVTPYSVKSKSNRKVWWLCPICKYDWEAPVYSRSGGSGCPACAGRVVTTANCLETVRPDIAKEWSPDNTLKPNQVTANSSYRALWICGKCKHKWHASVDNRSRGKGGCGVCAGRIVNLTNCLATQKPDIATEWHPNRNFPITPFDVTPHGGNRKKFWWKCPICSHDYQSSLNNRSNGKGCPACAGQAVTIENCLATTCPELLIEWHPTLNDILPTEVTPKSDKKVWWQCKDNTCNNVWQAQVKHRTNGTGCPKCASGMRTSFPEQAIFYYLKQVFNDTLNGYKFSVKGGRPFEGDIYVPSLRLVIEYDGFRHNSDVARERDERKNIFFDSQKIQLLRIRGNDYPDIEPYNSSVIITNVKNMNPVDLKAVLLLIRKYIVSNFCIDKHQCSLLDDFSNIDISEDSMLINEKTKTKVLNNSLALHYFDLVLNEWDFEKNAPLNPFKVSYGSGIKAWWICPRCGNSHQYRIDSKRQGINGCKKCSKISETPLNKASVHKSPPLRVSPSSEPLGN